MTPEFDFVFDYNLNQVAPFALTVVFTGGFQLFDINNFTETALIRFSSDRGVNGLTNNENIAANNLIKIFPNPFKDRTSLELQDNTTHDVLLFDVMGKLLREYKDVNNKLIIERGSLNSGTYLLKIINGSETRIDKLIIE